MDFGDVWMALGIDFALVQGAVTHLYENDPAFQRIEGEIPPPDTAPPGTEGTPFRLELIMPLIEARPACADLPFRLVLHLVGDLFVGELTTPLLFEAFVRLDPGVGTDDDGMPVGLLGYGGIEGVKPEPAKDQLDAAFQPTGTVGQKLADLQLGVFDGLLDAATRVIHPPADPDDPVTIDPSEWAIDFWVGQPSAIRRPVYTVEDDEAVLVADDTILTIAALVATVAPAGSNPVPPDKPSIVRPATGLQLITTKAMFDAKLDNQEQATIGTTTEDDVEIDELKLDAADGGIEVFGKGHKTGATVEFEGIVITQYQGRTDGRLAILPAVDTDVDTEWWVDVLSVAAIVSFGLIGLLLVDAFVWQPKAEAPGKVEDTLKEEFTKPLLDAAQSVADAFQVDTIPAAAFLDDIWIFDGNFAVSVAAFLGRRRSVVEGATYDVAFVARRGNDAKPVKSVNTVLLDSGHSLTPWQLAQVMTQGILDVPGHHVVESGKARGGAYVRSNPNDTKQDNLVV